MKKYALLAGEQYYPSRGINDLVGFYDTVCEARQRYGDGMSIYSQYDWGQVVETNTWKIIEEMAQ